MAWVEPRDWTLAELVTQTHLNEQIRDNLNAMFPIGFLMLRVANYTTVETAVENRWLQCNGVAVSRTTYAQLFSYLNGLTPALPFGAGDGSTTFHLPDMRGRMPVAQGEHADADAMGDTDGTAIASRTPKHKHTTFNSVGGGTAGATYITRNAQFADYGTLNVGPQTNTPTDTPAYLVVGSWFIKYRS